MSLQKLYLLTFPNLVATTDIKWTHFVHIGVLSGLFCLFWLNLRSRSRKIFCLIFKKRLYDLGPWPNITRAVGLGGKRGLIKIEEWIAVDCRRGPWRCPCTGSRILMPYAPEHHTYFTCRGAAALKTISLCALSLCFFSQLFHSENKWQRRMLLHYHTSGWVTGFL